MNMKMFEDVEVVPKATLPPNYSNINTYMKHVKR